MKEIITEKYIVRIHDGKRTEEERREALKHAAERFYRAIQTDLDRADRDCLAVKQ